MKPCGCGVLLGEECDCAAFAASAARVFAERPLVLRTSPADPAARTAPTAFDPPFLAAMRTAAIDRFDAKGQPR